MSLNDTEASNNGMQRTVLRAAADAERSAPPIFYFLNAD